MPALPRARYRISWKATSAAAERIRASWQRFRKPPRCKRGRANDRETEFRNPTRTGTIRTPRGPALSLRNRPPRIFQISRRGCFDSLRRKGRAWSAGIAQRHSGEALPQEISAWLHVGEDGSVTVFTGKVEVGQNIRTSLTQAVAEELHVAVDKIQMVMGDTQLTHYDRGTFGSLSTPVMNYSSDAQQQRLATFSSI